MRKMFVFLAAAAEVLSLTVGQALAFDSAPVGWASMDGGTTGGAGGTVVEVNDANSFINYVQNQHQDPYIIYVSGNIDLGSSNIRVRGNKTIIGRPGSHITGNLKSYRAEEGNDIFRFLDMDNYDKVGDGDCITIDSASHIWVDHCTFTDGGDGEIDIKNGADYITVSWCIFQYTYDSGHNFTNLIGHDDGNGDTDMGHLLVTFHHNWYSTLCHERMPSVRFGTAHIYNTYFDCPGNNYCIRTRLYAQCLVENNYFKDVQNPWERYVTSAGGDPGLLHASGNILDNVTWNAGSDSQVVLIDGNDSVFGPNYSYTLDDANLVPGIVQWGAGADGKEGAPPHWYFTYYGDFDLSSKVDLNDLETFVDYWLDTNDTADINNADYNGDGIVNGYEYALLAANYLYVPLDTTPPAAPADLWAQGADSVVTLDWADNGEPDFAGYNVYRSTASGSGYTKLNGALLTDSNFVDDTVTNGTMYYYVATAVDTNDNESADSVEACAEPNVNTSITIQENATGFCGVEGIIDNKHAGYTGSGFCDTQNASGTGIDWSVNFVSAGTYTFTWRYAHGKTDDRTARLLVDGSPVVASIAFDPTGDFTTWETVSVDVSMTTGTKDIRLEGTTSNSLANIDYLMVTGADPAIAPCP
jgi:pectate lyase